MHLAYYRLHRHIPPTYESAGTRKFQLGRMDTSRTASMTYNDATKQLVNTQLKYEQPDLNASTQHKRQRNVMWYNPPYR